MIGEMVSRWNMMADSTTSRYNRSDLTVLNSSIRDINIKLLIKFVRSKYNFDSDWIDTFHKVFSLIHHLMANHWLSLLFLLHFAVFFIVVVNEYYMRYFCDRVFVGDPNREINGRRRRRLARLPMPHKNIQLTELLWQLWIMPIMR